jgi:hypothetical protein
MVGMTGAVSLRQTLHVAKIVVAVVAFLFDAFLLMTYSQANAGRYTDWRP